LGIPRRTAGGTFVADLIDVTDRLHLDHRVLIRTDHQRGGDQYYLEDAARSARWNRVLAVTREPLVSTDIIGEPHAAIVDLSLTTVVDGNLCSVYSWYDNEVDYANSLIQHVVEAAKIPVPSAPT
jgi:glyceraldehyde-3-phosphate dehydrogenase/erythrose-4-phosphate dehydrogenase